MLFLLLFACVKQNGMVTHVSASGDECAYVAIRKDKTTGLIFRDHKYLREVDSVFLCCPNDEGKPICKKAGFPQTTPKTSSSRLLLPGE